MGQEGYKVGLPIGFQCAQEEARGENGNKYKKNGGVFTNRVPAVFYMLSDRGMFFSVFMLIFRNKKSR
jgi:hypothetical protein